MATGATGQLGLALPVQGELTGSWGNTVNNGITEYTNIAIAATLTLTGDGAVTLANTTGDASASNITSTLTGAGTVTAQFAIVQITGTLTTTKVVTGPSYSKTYVVDNAATGGSVTFKAATKTGVTIAVGEKCTVYYNGDDYVKVASSTADGVTTFSAGTTGFTPSTATTGAVTLAGTLAIANGGTGTTSTTFANLTTNVTGTLPTANGGTNLGGATPFTSGGVVYASSTSALATGSGLVFSGTNLGLGVTPSPWSSGKAIEVGFLGNGIWGNGASSMITSTNAYFNGAWLYAGTGRATNYEQSSGSHLWFNSASGTAGNAISFTQAMTLDTSGNLLVGSTSSSAVANKNIDVNGTGDAALVVRVGGTTTSYLYSTAGTTILGTVGALPIVVSPNGTERARFDAVGNLLVGGSAARGTTAGTAHLDLFNGTAPAGTLTNGVSLYSDSGDLKFMNAAGDAFDVGYRNIPQNAQTGNYTLTLADSGDHIYHAVGAGAATYTIPANSSVAYPIGTALTFVNMSSTSISIAITTDTMYLAKDGTTGTRTLAQYGSATALKLTSTTWLISGSALT